jgi:glucose-6-phosphate isomerase
MRALKLLIELASKPAARQDRRDVWRQEINVTEIAPCCTWHCVRQGRIHLVDGKSVVPEVHARQMVTSPTASGGQWKGQRQRIRDMSNIGIGGSDLGPVMAYEAQVLPIAP